MAIKDLKNCYLVVQDGVDVTGGPGAAPTIDATGKVTFSVDAEHSCLVKMGQGNLTWSEKAGREYLLNQGKLDTVRNGDQAPVDLSFEGQFEFYKNNDYGGNWSPGGTGTGSGFAEIVKGSYGMTPAEATAAGFISVDPDGCQPYACDVYVLDTPICTGAVTNAKEVLYFTKFRYETFDGDFKAGMLKVSGKCNILSPTATRS